MKQNYTYAAIFDYNEEGYVNINFPMFEGAFSCVIENDNPVEAAQEVLTLAISAYEDDHKELPSENIRPEAGENQHIVYVNVFMPYQMAQMKEVRVKKTLTIPAWLDDLAKNKGINFSETLTEALKDKLYM